MNTEHKIIEIKAIDTLDLRQKVLKPFLKKQECTYPEDNLTTTFHLGLFENEKLVSIATFISQASDSLSAGCPYRLRGMATEESFRRKGHGKLLVHYGLQILKSRGCDLVWCNARFKAFKFYESLGFIGTGPLFDLPQIGPHKIMYKILIPR